LDDSTIQLCCDDDEMPAWSLFRARIPLPVKLQPVVFFEQTPL